MEDTELDEELGLDQETEIVDEEQAVDAPEAEEQESPEPEEELIFKEDAKEPDEETPLITSFRQRERAKDKELRKLRQELEAVKKSGSAKEPDVLGPEPKMVDYDFDEEKFLPARDAWVLKQAKIKEKEQAVTSEYTQKLSAYNVQKAKVSEKVSDYNDAHEAVAGRLTIAQQNLLLLKTATPTAIVYSLGRNLDELERFARIEDPVDFTAALIRLEMSKKGPVKLEAELSVERKAGVAPEPRVPRGAGTGSASAVNSEAAYKRELDRLEKEYERTGDRTAIRKLNARWNSRNAGR